MPDVQELNSTEIVSEQPEVKGGWGSDWRVRFVGAAIVGILSLAVILVAVEYVRLARRIDSRLAAGPFAGTLNIFSAPKTLVVGDELNAEDLAGALQRRGYEYRVRGGEVEVPDGSRLWQIAVRDGKISRISSTGAEQNEFTLEPRLITNLSRNREKRRLVKYSEIPPTLVHAVMSAEDKHFFQHSGFDTLRIMKAAYVDLKDNHKSQGASTLTMQLARGFWLEPDKSWRRKFEEVLIATELERRLTKQQIFEDYANEVYLGRSGSFSINGFGEASRSYFGKEIAQLNDAEAALLAGIIQRPSYYNPRRYVARARERRNIVLALMRQNGYLTEPQYRAAVATPVQVIAERPETQESQYFFDLMSDELQTELDDSQQRARAVYTTLDPDLQRAAIDAVRIGMQSVDQELHKRKATAPAGQPQVALIALDPHTGAIRALIGGRDYRTSQLNRILAMRQPGSVFKPFVYAAALNTAVERGRRVFTPASTIDDERATFLFGRTAYQPGNFHGGYMGSVSLRTALAHSLNSATVALAQAVGYDRVVELAKRAGLNEAIQPTPSVALGAYEATPLEIAGAYTMFANQGLRVSPTTIDLVRTRDDKVLYQHETDARQALDPRVAYLMVSMMQEVLRSGTGAGVRSHGFTLPAAGKTGTSRDGWFAGFTSQLLCVVWVGFDDNRDLNLEGAHSALPIWAEFMKRAARFREYRDARPFQAPPGVVSVRLCNESGLLAGEFCPDTRTEVFVSGTQPAEQCELHTEYASPEGSADRVEIPAAQDAGHN